MEVERMIAMHAKTVCMPNDDDKLQWRAYIMHKCHMYELSFEKYTWRETN